MKDKKEEEEKKEEEKKEEEAEKRDEEKEETPKKEKKPRFLDNLRKAAINVPALFQRRVGDRVSWNDLGKQ